MQITHKKRVLFICSQNSARSQMAEALLRMLYGERYEAYSAGIVASHVDPYAIKALEQLGVDMSHHRSKAIEEFRGQEFDYVVTVCDQAKETCPYFPGRNIMHHNFTKPATQGSEAEILQSFAQVRDEILAWIEEQFGDKQSGNGTEAD